MLSNHEKNKLFFKDMCSYTPAGHHGAHCVSNGYLTYWFGFHVKNKDLAAKITIKETTYLVEYFSVNIRGHETPLNNKEVPHDCYLSLFIFNNLELEEG